MDLRMEAAAAAELGNNFADDPTFRVPKVDWERTAKRVMTSERIQGIPVDERDALIAAGHDPTDILAKAAAIFFNQVFRDGFFHADQHPGNAFVAPDGAIVAVDFGIMGRLDRAHRIYLADMLVGFLRRDYRAVARVHFRAGFVPPNKSIDNFTQALRAIAEPILDKPLHEISVARLLGQLFEVTETFDMETQPQLLLLQKTMLVTEGVGRKLNPEVNMWEMARPLIEEWVLINRGPQARLREAVETVADAIDRLPVILANAEKAAGHLAKIAEANNPHPKPAPTPTLAQTWPLWAALIALGIALAIAI